MNKSFKRTIAAVSMTAMLAAGFAMPVFAATQVEVTGNPVMIRADAGLKNTVVSKAHKGDKYDYVGQKKDSTGRVWYNIKYSGNKTGWITSQFAKKTEASAANPVKDYEGTYQYGRASLTVKATGKDSADITVEWANGASGNTVWTFSGSFDTDTYRINYSKGVKTDYTYDSKGNVSSKKVVYKDGMGRVQFHSKTELVWRDEKELEKGEMTFTKINAAEPEQPAATAKQVQITATPVNVRSGAGTNYKKLGKTSKGKTYTYLASKKDSSGRVWYQIQYTSKTKGWVMGSLAKLVGESTTVTPVKDYEGTYQYGRASLTVKATGTDSADITVEWANSASKKTVWTFSGSFDTDTYRINYSKGVKTDYTYDSKGNVSSKKVVYKDGTGRVQFHSKTELVWRDENEQDKGEMTFTKVSAAEPEQPASTTKQVQITGSSVNVRSGAGTNYKKLGSTSKGKKYTYLASKKASNGRVWYQIQYTSKTKGWVSSGYAKLVSTSTVDYSGEYVETAAGRATITITKKASGYDVWVRWPNGASEVYNWNFSGTFNSSGVMNYTKCVKTIVTFGSNGNDSTKTSYSNGTGSLTIKNGTVTWKDNKENAGKDVKFVKE